MDKLLIVGLGNPGVGYQETRHNIGFKIIDYLADKFDLIFKNQKHGLISSFQYKGRTITLMKPSTFMNLSGKAVRYHLVKNKIKITNLLIVSDDLHLPFGSIKVKRKGSDGGHNGHKDIIDKLESSNYSRLKFGIGNDFLVGKQSNYVLDMWSEKECDVLNNLIEKSSKAVLSFCTVGIELTMKNFN
ncbi:MAG: aminoacyl-tRNA hydrolase [Flavobacteriales bacterium]|nr:aminoacyl-tRNA hydrolase [Flavobacteriales bacterium]|tara:strand:+ start:1772 stop:2332 length:561 start_codon:yes stop_codon:yes gene_type:complete